MVETVIYNKNKTEEKKELQEKRESFKQGGSETGKESWRPESSNFCIFPCNLWPLLPHPGSREKTNWHELHTLKLHTHTKKDLRYMHAGKICRSRTHTSTREHAQAPSQIQPRHTAYPSTYTYTRNAQNVHTEWEKKKKNGIICICYYYYHYYIWIWSNIVLFIIILLLVLYYTHSAHYYIYTI